MLGDPANITDCFVRAQIRRKALDPAVLATFAVAVIDAAGGRVEMVLTDEITAAIPAGEMLKDPLSAAVWDAEFEDSTGDVFPIRYGDVLILREVTRPI